VDLQLTTATGKSSKKAVTVSEANFGREYSPSLVHQAVTAYMAGARQGTRANKSRADVAGGGIKPWRQKGTGRARAGTMSSPIWRSGGVTFAARPRDFSQKLNKKMYRNAIKSILSELVRQERLVIVENFKVDTLKTKDLVSKLDALALDSVLIVVDELSDNLGLASRNLHKVQVAAAKEINPVSLVGSEKVLITAEAIKQIEGILQ